MIKFSNKLHNINNLPRTLDVNIDAEHVCKFCTDEFNFDNYRYFYSYITNTKFLCCNSYDNLPPCKIKNVIYLITCNNCNVQYVGKTERALGDRACGHRHGIKYGSDSAILLYKHFSTVCTKFDIKYKIIEIVPNNQNILDRENYWISKLMTIYPFGLNNQVKGVGNIFYKDFLNSDFQNPYFNLPVKTRRPGKYGRHGNRKVNSSKKKLNRSDINLIVNNLYLLYNSFGIKKLTNSLKGLQKKSFAPLVEYILDNKNNFSKSFKDIVFAFMGYIRANSKTLINKSTNNKVISTLKYSSKILDNININSLINSKLVKSKLPDEFKLLNPVIAYSFDRPVGSIITNYNSTLNDLTDFEIFNNSKCVCERVVDMPENRRNALRNFIYSPTGHIVTGDVELVKHFANDKVAELCRKGYKYRIGNNKLSWGRILNDLTNAINQLKIKLANKVHCEVNMLDPWARCLIKITTSKIFALRSKINLSDFINYDYHKLKLDLVNLHKHFVITTVDKANNNYSFICKKFYLATIKKELGISGNISHKNVQGNSVYEIQNNLDINDLIDEHTTNNSDLDIKLSDRNKCVPKLYMIPKFHKRPYKYRFISGAKFATTKPLSEQVVQCLKYIKSTHRRYCNTIY